MEKTIKKYGRVDVLLNIGGWGSYGWIENLSPEDPHLILHPRRELMLGRLYGVPAFINRYFPFFVDEFMKRWVASMRKNELRKGRSRLC